MTGLEAWLAQQPLVLVGLGASLVAGLATAVGALPVLAFGRPDVRVQNLMLGFAAGVMLAATAFSLVLPGVEAAERQGFGALGAAGVVAAGIALGALAVWAVNEAVPHEHFVKGPEGGSSRGHGADPARLGRLWLFVLAITIHNFPEGLSVGVGFGGGPAPADLPGVAPGAGAVDVANGLALTVGIGLQNAPEGLAVAAALIAEGYSRGRALWVALLTGLVEPVGGLVGAGAVSLAAPVLPWALAFAAGAMLFVISGEIIPETHRKGRATGATFAVTVGFIAMMVLDVALG